MPAHPVSNPLPMMARVSTVQRAGAGAARSEAFDVDAADAALLEQQRSPRADQKRGQLAHVRFVSDERDGGVREVRGPGQIGDEAGGENGAARANDDDFHVSPS